MHSKQIKYQPGLFVMWLKEQEKREIIPLCDNTRFFLISIRNVKRKILNYVDKLKWKKRKIILISPVQNYWATLKLRGKYVTFFFNNEIGNLTGDIHNQINSLYVVIIPQYS